MEFTIHSHIALGLQIIDYTVSIAEWQIGCPKWKVLEKQTCLVVNRAQSSTIIELLSHLTVPTWLVQIQWMGGQVKLALSEDHTYYAKLILWRILLTVWKSVSPVLNDTSLFVLWVHFCHYKNFYQRWSYGVLPGSDFGHTHDLLPIWNNKSIVILLAGGSQSIFVSITDSGCFFEFLSSIEPWTNIWGTWIIHSSHYSHRASYFVFF